MININKFIQIRKKLGFSQIDLCEGICTQSTLSKFENNGRIPSLKILSSLCARMDVSLAEIMNTNENNEVAKKLFDADLATIQFDFPKIARILSSITKDDLLRQKDIYHYYYLRGLMALELDHDQRDALYYFDSILNSKKMRPDNIYHVLALAGCSQVFEFQEDFAKADQYYQSVLKRIDSIPINDANETLQILSILFHAGAFYGKQKDFQKSDKLLHDGYDICSQKHVIYYLGRILFQLAQNSQAQNNDPIKTQTYLNDSEAFARLYHNRVLLHQLKQFQRQ